MEKERKKEGIHAPGSPYPLPFPSLVRKCPSEETSYRKWFIMNTGDAVNILERLTLLKKKKKKKKRVTPLPLQKRSEVLLS